jgi:hypothetical protein
MNVGCSRAGHSGARPGERQSSLGFVPRRQQAAAVNCQYRREYGHIADHTPTRDARSCKPLTSAGRLTIALMNYQVGTIPAAAIRKKMAMIRRWRSQRSLLGLAYPEVGRARRSRGYGDGAALPYSAG